MHDSSTPINYDVNTIVEIGRYGLGTKRTLDQLIAFMGIDFRNKKIYGNRFECIVLNTTML
jgi:hypothetical protein